MENKTSSSLKETLQLGSNFAQYLMRSGLPFLIGLTGDLGAGKTTFVQGMAQGLGFGSKGLKGSKGYVTSPTFTLINEYSIPKAKIYQHLIHVDLYRMDQTHGIESNPIGFDLEEYRKPHHLIVVEWPEKIPSIEKELDFQVIFETDTLTINRRCLLFKDLR